MSDEDDQSTEQGQSLVERLRNERKSKSPVVVSEIVSEDDVKPEIQVGLVAQNYGSGKRTFDAEAGTDESVHSIAMNIVNDGANNGNRGLVAIYEAIPGKTEEMVHCQKRIHRYFIENKYKWLKPIFATQDYFAGLILRKEKPSIDSLFTRQISSVDQLSRLLDNALQWSRDKLERLEDYRSHVLTEGVTEWVNRGDLEQQIKDKYGERQQLKKQLKSTEKLTLEYVNLKNSIEKLDDEIYFLTMKYNSAGETTGDNLSEEERLGKLKNFYKFNIEICQKISDKVKRINRNLKNTWEVYRDMILTQNIAEHLYKQVSATTGFVRDVHSLATMNLLRNSRALSSGSMYMLDSIGSDTSSSLQVLGAERVMLNEQNDQRITDYINSR